MKTTVKKTSLSSINFNVNLLPNEVTTLIICTKPENVFELIKSAIAKNIRHVWVQQGAQHDKALQFVLDNGMYVIHRKCVLMFANLVVSLHTFHRGLKKLFGTYPKPY